MLVGWGASEADAVLRALPRRAGVAVSTVPEAAAALSVPGVVLLREHGTAPAAEDMLAEFRALCPSSERPVILVLRQTWAGRARALMDAGADDCALETDLETLELRVRIALRALSRQGDLLRTCEEYRQRALRDALTGAFNRGAILEILEMELHRASRLGSQVGILLADVDHFKSLNDEFGHLAGDAALQAVADTMRRSLRPYDSLGRYGGEEFLVVLPDCPPEVTSTVAERLRAQVETLRSPRGLTVSLGTAQYGGTVPESPLHYVEVADGALYEAKRAGRNRVITGRQPRGGPVVVLIGGGELLDLFRRAVGEAVELRVCRRVQDAIPHLRSAELVVTDPTLPGRGGLDFLQQARERGLEAPVLVVGEAAPEGLPTLSRTAPPEEVASVLGLLLRSRSAPPLP